MGYHAGIYPLFSGFPSFSISVFADVYLFRCLMPQAHFHAIASIRSKKARPLRAGQRDNPTDYVKMSRAG
jgi:hypothetical protein